MSALLTPRRKRLLLVLVAAALLVAAGAFVKEAFRSNLALYVTPGELAGHAHAGETLNVGGLVQPGSLQRASGTLDVRFTLTDGSSHNVPVVYTGVLPDLFAEGKGAIAKGKLDASGTLVATEVLAKHDENYTPPNVQPQTAQAAPATQTRQGAAP